MLILFDRFFVFTNGNGIARCSLQWLVRLKRGSEIALFCKSFWYRTEMV